MGDKTKISWTDASWNPVRGCSRVSEGCRNCYAETMAGRFSGPGQPYEGLTAPHVVAGGRVEHRWTGQMMFVPDKLAEPLRWTRPRRVFVNSMSDLFHAELTDAMIDTVFAVMAMAPQHQFQVLTKRPERMLLWFTRRYLPVAVCDAMQSLDWLPRCRGFPRAVPAWPLPNVWLGVSVEDQRAADGRIPLLLRTPATVRFVSVEPLLGPVDLRAFLRIAWQCSGCRNYFPDPWRKTCPSCGCEDYWSGSHAFNPSGGQRGSGIDWVIVGGESGRGARPCNVEHVRAVRDQCVRAGVPVFVKQVGAFVVDRNDAGFDGCDETSWPCPADIEHDIHGYRENHQGADCRVHLIDRKGGNPDEWPEDLRIREFPKIDDQSRATCPTNRQAAP